MSVIHGQSSLATGIDTAILAIRKAQDRFGVAAREVAQQGASLSESASAKEIPKNKPPTQTPPNPGPPGGAHPADLAQAMVAQNLASYDLAANVKTVQAFDAMLEELTRLTKKPA